MVDMAHYAGLVAAGLHDNPVKCADFVTTTTHKTLRGPRSGIVLCKEEYAKDVDKTVFPGLQGGPLVHIIAAKAVCFHEALQPSFKEYGRADHRQRQGAGRDADVGGPHPLVRRHRQSPDALRRHHDGRLTGKIAEKALDRAGITVNKNMIPYDPRKPLDPSGIRIGTPALTTRGMKEPEMKRVGQWILTILKSPADEKLAAKVRSEIAEFATNYPVPGID